MNAHLSLLAGVFALLAVGVVGAAGAPGLSMNTGATAPATHCELAATLQMPSHVMAGSAAFPIVAQVHASHCTAFSVKGYLFQGAPYSSGASPSTSGVLWVNPTAPGEFDVLVVAYTTIGNVGTSGAIAIQ